MLPFALRPFSRNYISLLISSPLMQIFWGLDFKETFTGVMCGLHEWKNRNKKKMILLWLSSGVYSIVSALCSVSYVCTHVSNNSFTYVSGNFLLDKWENYHSGDVSWKCKWSEGKTLIQRPSEDKHFDEIVLNFTKNIQIQQSMHMDAIYWRPSWTKSRQPITGDTDKWFNAIWYIGWYCKFLLKKRLQPIKYWSKYPIHKGIHLYSVSLTGIWANTKTNQYSYFQHSVFPLLNCCKHYTYLVYRNMFYSISSVWTGVETFFIQ